MPSEKSFNLKKAAIFQAVNWEKTFAPAKNLKKGFGALFVLLFLLFLYRFLVVPGTFSAASLSGLFWFSVIFLIFSIICWETESFFNWKIKKPSLPKSLIEAIDRPTDFNFAEFLDLESAKVIWEAIKFSKRKKLSQISSEAILFYALQKSKEINFIFSRSLLNPDNIKNDLKQYLDGLAGASFQDVLSEDSQKAIYEAAKIAQKRERKNIKIGDILVAESRINPIFKQHLIDANLKPEDIENLTWWFENMEKRVENRKRFWDYKNLLKKGSIAKDWASGYTVTLDKFSTDWTEVIRQRGYEDVIGHKEEIDRIERILSRDQINNALIVGEAGIGKISIVHVIAQKALFDLGSPQINSKRVVSLDILAILSKVGAQEAENVLDIVFKEAVSAGNVILVIDDFHNYIGQERRPGIVDIGGVITSYLRLPNFQIIALTNYPGLHRNIESNPGILNLFEKIEVLEISEQETIMLLENKVSYYEKKYKRFVTYPAIRDIVKFSARYIQDSPFPKKALDLFDEIITYVSRYTKSQTVLPEHVARVISEKTQIPIGEIEVQERETLLNLENLIHQRIIDQEEAVREVSGALRRARADITVRKGPMGCFLFLGPTGVGKTETSKALAEVYFGSENRIIRLDMSEFQNITDIARLLGTADSEGILTTPVRENPFSLVLLDEIEKSHPNILNLFLQVLDEGFVTDGLGRKVSFKNTIIIATSNAGYQIILDAFKKGKAMAEIKDELLDFLFKQGNFRPEFINRFDAVVLFKGLSKKDLLAIAGLLLQKLKKNLKEKDIDFVITDGLKEKIVELGYDQVFGARQMRRVIQDKIENVLAVAMLSKKIKKGNSVQINPANFELEIL